MTLRYQIEASTYAANTSAVWKHLKLSERERRKHHYKHKTPTARDCLALNLMSPMRRGRGGCCWLLWWLKSRNGLKRLVNKLQNLMFSKTCTNCMYSNSAALSSPRQVSKSKVRGNSALKHCYSSFAHFHYIFLGMHDIYQTDKLSTDVGENDVIFIAPINKWNPIFRSDKVHLLRNQSISLIYLRFILFPSASDLL